MERIAQVSQVMLSPEPRVTGEVVKEMLQTRFFFGLAELPFPDQINSLLRLMVLSRLFYGSSCHYTLVPAVFLSEVKDHVYLRNAQDHNRYTSARRSFYALLALE